jgi:hypothetical protein
MLGSSDNIVGGGAVGAGNVISATDGFGVFIEGFFGTPADRNVVEGNLIGTQADGISPLGNMRQGILVRFGPAADNEILRNVIAFNASAGVSPAGILIDEGLRTMVSENSIHANGGLGIDLDPPGGVTLNDSGDGDTGGNALQNFPDLTSAKTLGGTTVVEGKLDSTASTQFSIEFFSSTSCDASGHGEGETFLGSTSVMTNGTGTVSFTFDVGSQLPVGTPITTTATDPSGNTSEFSGCLAVVLPLLSAWGTVVLLFSLAMAGGLLRWRWQGT